MRYLDAYRAAFSHPKWVGNLAWLSLAIASTSFIPVFGQLIAFGYLFDVVEFLHLHGEDSTYPGFNWNRLTHYLSRGGWVFLVLFLVLIPCLIVAAIPFVVLMIIAIAVGNGENAPVILAFVVCSVFYFLLLLIVNFVLTPLLLRAGLTQEFRRSFDWGFVKDFVRRTWMEILISALFQMVFGALVHFVGFLCCCVGVYAAIGLNLFAHHHLTFQLYELYLQRGGTPIPLKDDPFSAHDELPDEQDADSASQ